MGHESLSSDPWPIWPIQFWWPIRPIDPWPIYPLSALHGWILEKTWQSKEKVIFEYNRHYWQVYFNYKGWCYKIDKNNAMFNPEEKDNGGKLKITLRAKRNKVLLDFETETDSDSVHATAFKVSSEWTVLLNWYIIATIIWIRPRWTLKKLKIIALWLFSIISSSGSYIAKPTLTLIQLHWLPIEQRIRFKIAVITYKVRCGAEPVYLYELLKDHVSRTGRQLRSCDGRLLEKPFVRSSGAMRGFSCAAPSVWNNLGSHCRLSNSLSSFRKTLKTELFELAINEWPPLPSWCIRVAPGETIAH